MRKTEASNSSTVQDEEEHLFSDDSSFYGDSELKAEYEERCRTFDVLHYWEHIHPFNVQTISAKPWTINKPSTKIEAPESSGDWLLNRKQMEDDRLARMKEMSGSIARHSTKPEEIGFPAPDPMDIDKPSSILHNLYEGERMAKQLNESLKDFLTRLQPSATTIASGPWIYIANPHASNKHLYRNQQGFIDEGNRFLDVYMSRKKKLEEENPNLAPGTITKKLKPERQWLEETLLDLVKKHSVTNGKWMLFPNHQQVDEIWTTVAKATLEGRLGVAAKVATDASDGKSERLIAVYTGDFSDVGDVKRVLKEMRRLGLVNSGQGARWIYYKIDAYTYLNINRDNEYKLKASIYSSKDMLPEIDYELL